MSIKYLKVIYQKAKDICTDRNMVRTQNKYNAESISDKQSLNVSGTADQISWEVV